MTTPYAGLPDHQFWRRSVSRTEAHRFDPMVSPRFRIAPTDKVATAGSCFAQHIARHLRRLGDTYFVTEAGETLPPAQREAGQYGVFSARYGNIYTPMQLWQLFREAYGRHTPHDRAWQAPNGGWVDPFRQTVEPGGFASVEALLADRAQHLAAVRRIVDEADVFVFTLGLTEAWRSKVDGSVYAQAPGVTASAFDPEQHEFVNFTVAETEGALNRFLIAAKKRNPSLRVILTVSPVPLMATYEPRNVVVSTTYSKAVLRVAAETMYRRYDWVDYFPSYEIITASPTGGLYFEEDAREVNTLGVAHAMRTFVRHYVSPTQEGAERASAPAARAPELAIAASGGVICDEELIDQLRV